MYAQSSCISTWASRLSACLMRLCGKGKGQLFILIQAGISGVCMQHAASHHCNPDYSDVDWRSRKSRSCRAICWNVAIEAKFSDAKTYDYIENRCSRWQIGRD